MGLFALLGVRELQVSYGSPMETFSRDGSGKVTRWRVEAFAMGLFGFPPFGMKPPKDGAPGHGTMGSPEFCKCVNRSFSRGIKVENTPISIANRPLCTDEATERLRVK
jgi:hypothetical protein